MVWRCSLARALRNWKYGPAAVPMQARSNRIWRGRWPDLALTETGIYMRNSDPATFNIDMFPVSRRLSPYQSVTAIISDPA